MSKDLFLSSCLDRTPAACWVISMFKDGQGLQGRSYSISYFEQLLGKGKYLVFKEIDQIN